MATAPNKDAGLNLNAERPKVVAGPYARTVAAYRFIVLHEISEKKIPARGDRAEMIIYQQPVVIVGGPRQINWTLGSMDKESILEEGVYLLSNDCISVGQYDRLEVKTRSENFVRVGDLKAEHRELFEAPATDLSDLIGGNV